MNVDTNCQVLVIYKCYTFITAIFQVIKQRQMGPIDIYMSWKHASAENTHLNNDLSGAWHYQRRYTQNVYRISKYFKRLHFLVRKYSRPIC